MAATHRPFAVLVLILSLGLFAASCGSSNDPQTWAEAEADGNLRPNFIRACTEANADGGDLEFDEAQAAAYCECAFVEIVEYFGGEIDGDNVISDVAAAAQGRDFEAFKQFESDLRSDPQDIPGDVRGFLTGCASQAAP